LLTSAGLTRLEAVRISHSGRRPGPGAGPGGLREFVGSPCDFCACPSWRLCVTLLLILGALFLRLFLDAPFSTDKVAF
jgi:hypothetical protein